MLFSSPLEHNQSHNIQTDLFSKPGKLPAKGTRITVFKRSVFHIFSPHLVQWGSILAWN